MRSGCWHYNTALLEKCWWISLYVMKSLVKNRGKMVENSVLH